MNQQFNSNIYQNYDQNTINNQMGNNYPQMNQNYMQGSFINNNIPMNNMYQMNQNYGIFNSNINQNFNMSQKSKTFEKTDFSYCPNWESLLLGNEETSVEASRIGKLLQLNENNQNIIGRIFALAKFLRGELDKFLSFI